MPVRANWRKRVEDLGFQFHSVGGKYWTEDVAYELTLDQVEQIESATTELFDMCLAAVQYVIDNNLFSKFGVDERFIPSIVRSWNDDVPSVYGRFDFAYDGVNPPKMLEFNADTPTSLFEAGVVQWYWLEDVMPHYDQFNSVHEKLVATWKTLGEYLNEGPLHFACVKDNAEDHITTVYMQDCAMQAGLQTEFVFMEDIGWCDERKCFVDMQDNPIRNIFKLYPWEWMCKEKFADDILTTDALWIEPTWKMLLSNKAILPILWERNEGNPLLLPSYFESDRYKAGSSYVKKPILSREGANVTVVIDGQTVEATQGEYGDSGYVYQALAKIPSYDGKRPIIGSWVIGCEPAGIGIRESDTMVTDNLSRFVPHYIKS